MRETLTELFIKRFNQLLNEHPDVKQVDVAKAVGVSSATISEWRKGRKSPRLDKVKKVAAFFDVDMDFFFGAPEAPEYDPDMLTLIDLYSRLSDKNKKVVLSLAKSLVE